MLKEFSAHSLGNSELIFMMITIGIVLLISSIIYKSLPRKKAASQMLSDLPDYCRKSRTFRKLDAHDWFWMILLTLCYSIISLWNLGSFETIDSYWQPTTANEEVIFELKDTQFDAILWVAGEGNNNANPTDYQNHVNFTLLGSNDLAVWDEVAQLNSINYLNIQKNSGQWDYQYIKLISNDTSNVLNEIGFQKTGTQALIELSIYSSSNPDSMYSAEKLIDEQNFLKSDPSYMDETYFDEIYHTRNAQEIADEQFMYSYVHPLLGTQLIALGIELFGLSPFGWRIMGALFGIFMMPLMYLCGLHLFHQRRSAILASFLLGIEFLHYTTSRIGTLEPFSIFFILLMSYFMMKYTQTSFYDTPLKKQFSQLALSGIFMGCACATKFTGVYGGIGLAILFFFNIFERTKEYIQARKRVKEPNANEQDWMIANSYWPKLIKTGLWCIVFFVIVPLCIYTFSYLPIVMSKTDSFSLKAVYDQTMGMYDYHKNLNATHPYQSVWWQWILDIRPIWYYVRYSGTTVNTISAFGNPIIFWCGAVAVLWCFVDAWQNSKHRAINISIAYLAQIVPWMMVERCIFIYHYYPAVPFLILAIVHGCESLLKQDKKYIRPIVILSLAALVVFVLFLPVIGGFATTSTYIQYVLRWMKGWHFG